MSYKRGRNPALVSAEYEMRLRSRCGDRLVNWLCGPHEAKHYTCADLRAMRAEFAAECRRLEKGLPPSRDWRALPKSEERAA